MSKGSEIWRRLQRLWSRNDGPEELANTAKALSEEEELEVLTMTKDPSIEEAEDTTRPSERLRRRRRRYVTGLGYRRRRRRRRRQ